jgi:PAS domain S-box-containing protein
MDILQNKTNIIVSLRQKAEKLLGNNSANSDLTLPAHDILKLLHELEVYQLELELQNEELMQSQTLAQNAIDLYNYAPNGYFTLSPSAEIIELNNTGATLLKEEKSKLIGSSFGFFVSNETKPIFTNFLQKVFRNKTNENCEITLSISNNIKIFVHLTGVVNKFNNQCLVTIIDISEKKQAEALILQERELFKDLVNNQPAGIYRLRVFPIEKWGNNSWENSKNPRYKVEMASNRFCEILGITRSVLEANTAIISDLVHPQDRPEFVLKNEVANAKISSFEWEGRLIIHDKIIWIHFESIPRPLENGDILWTGIMYDISERKQTELALKESDERFQLLFNKAPLGYQSLDINGRFIEVNQKWLDLLGYKHEEVIGKWFGDFMPPYYQELVKVNFPKFKEQGHVHSEFEMIHKNGTTLFIAFDGKIGLDVNGNFKQTHCILQDITENKRVNDALLEAEWKFNALFELGPIGVAYHKMIYDEAGEPVDYYFIDANESYNHLTGVSPKGMTARQAFPGIENDPADWIGTFGHVAKSGETIRFEQFLEPNGRWYDCVSYQYKPDHFVAAFNEITLRKQIESALKVSEEKFRNAFDNSTVGKSMTTIDGKLSVNKAFCKIVGYSEEEINQLNWKDITHKDDVQNNIEVVRSILNGEKDSVHWEKRYIRKNGKLVWVDITTSIQKNAEGEPLFFITEITDITERKQAERVLNESREQFKDLFDNAPVGYHEIDAQGRITRINQTELKMLGYTDNEVIGKYFWEFASDRVVSEQRILKKLKGKNISTTPYEREFWSKNGTKIPVLVQDVLLHDLNGNISGIRSTIQDITERKKWENALLQSEDKFKKAFLTSPDCFNINRLDDGMFIALNTGFTKTLGYSETETLGKTYIELNIWFDLEDRKKWIAELSENGSVDNFLARFRRKDGELIYGLVSASIIELNGIKHALSITRDITKLKKTEKALQQSEERFKLLFEDAPDSMFLADPESRKIVDANKAACLLFMKKKEELIGLCQHELHPSSVTNLSKKLFDDSRNNSVNNGSAQPVEHVILCSDGTEIPVEILAQQINIDNKCLTLGTFRDISKRKIMENEFQEREKILSTLFASMTEMVVIHDLVVNEIGEAIDYRIIDCNDTFTEITGIEKVDAKGKLATEVYQTGQAPYLEEYTKVCITGESMEYKTYYSPMNKHFLISAVCTGVNQFATITTDITAIQKTQELITEKNKELENYIYVASHDLRSPLVNIQGFSRRLEKQIDDIRKLVQLNNSEFNLKENLNRVVEKEIPKSLNFILTNVSKMDSLINSLLQLSRTGRITMSVQKTDMNKLVNSIVSVHNYELSEINATVHIDDLTECYGDENQLNQLFSNIISNAIKYRDKNRKLTIRFASRLYLNKVIYSISDSGMGINERHLSKIWDVFYRVDSSSPEAGEGIGLSLARRITEKHEGKIWVESEVGKGSTFYVELHRKDYKSAHPDVL